VNIVKVLRVLASERRLKILGIMNRTNQTSAELHRKFNSRYGEKYPRETIYRDLELLVNTGIVAKNYDRGDKKLYYTLTTEKVAIDLRTPEIKIG